MFGSIQSAREWSRFLLILASSLAIIHCAETSCTGGEYAFLVACRSYDSGEFNTLQFTENDVEALGKRLISVGYKESNVVLLTQTLGAQKAGLLPTGKNIRNTLGAMLAQLNDDDSIIIAFSGHGVQFPVDDQSYFCPMDAKLTDRSTLLSLTRLLTSLENSRAKIRILLVDACRSNPLVQNAKAARQIQLAPVGPVLKTPAGGVVAFVSCSAGESSFEAPQLKAGVFFHYLNDGLGGAADRDGDQEVTLSELESYVLAEVEAFTKRQFGVLQTPEIKCAVRGKIVVADLKNAVPIGLQVHIDKWLNRRLPCQIESKVDGTLKYRSVDLLFENFADNVATGVVYRFDQRVGDVTLDYEKEKATIQIVMGNYSSKFDLSLSDVVAKPDRLGYAAGQSFKKATVFQAKSSDSSIVLLELPENSAMLRSILQPSQFNRWGFAVEANDDGRDYPLVDSARKLLTPLQIGNGTVFSVVDQCADGPATITGRMCIEDTRRASVLNAKFELEVILDGNEQKPFVKRFVPGGTDKNFDFKATIPQGTRTVAINLKDIHGLVSYWSGMRIDW